MGVIGYAERLHAQELYGLVKQDEDARLLLKTIQTNGLVQLKKSNTSEILSGMRINSPEGFSLENYASQLLQHLETNGELEYCADTDSYALTYPPLDDITNRIAEMTMQRRDHAPIPSTEEKTARVMIYVYARTEREMQRRRHDYLTVLRDADVNKSNFVTVRANDEKTIVKHPFIPISRRDNIRELFEGNNPKKQAAIFERLYQQYKEGLPEQHTADVGTV